MKLYLSITMQNEGENTVCWVCLKLYECSLENEEATTIEMLGFLRLELDLDMTGKPVICKTCSENLKKCFDFKTACLYSEYCISSFKKDKNNVKMDLTEIYLRKKENENIHVSLAVFKCHDICRLCMEVVQLGCYVALNEEANDIIPVKTILRRYFPELDLDVTNSPIICTSCNVSLHIYYSFIKNCLYIKDETKKYCDIKGNNDKPREESNNVFNFAAENSLNFQNDCSGIDICNNPENGLNDEIKSKVEKLIKKKTQEFHIKQEDNEHDVDNKEENLNSALQGTRKMTCKNDYVDTNIEKKFYHNSEQHGEIELKCENFVKTESHEVYVKCENINMKKEDGEIAGRQDNMQIAKDASGLTIYQCKIFKKSEEMAPWHSFDGINRKDEVECNDEVKRDPWQPVPDNDEEVESEEDDAIWPPFDVDIGNEHANVHIVDNDNNSANKVDCDSKNLRIRQRLPTVAQQIILNMYEKLESEKGSKYGIFKRISELTSVSHSTIKRIVYRKCTMKRKIPIRGQLRKITTSTRDEIRNLISAFYKNGKIPTIDDIFNTIQEKQLHFPYKSRSTLWRLLSDMGIKFK